MKTTNRIRLRHIRCFLALAELGSMTRAAAALNTVQPALSRTLRELETELGQSLFERTGQGLVLSRAGETFRRHVATGMAQIERGISEACGIAEARTVSVGMLPNVARTLVPRAVSRFKETASDVDVRIHWANVSELVERLRHGEIDFLVGRLLSLDHMSGISFEHLYSETLAFVVRKEHALLDEAHVSLDDIDRHLVIVPLPNTIIRTEMDRFTVARGLAQFRNKIETVSFEFTRTYLAGSDAVACLPVGAIRQELADGRLVRLPVTGDELVSSVGMSFIAGRGLSPAASQMSDFVRDAAKAYATL
ncbi:LysR substrate-binding domain-containing protein [Zhengella mangrovi]|uniref:LysR substrate-binding domain-containing protein n=1 Tax=Zhengella mangrovi TaxID=1982044 RepID=UPI00197CB397|nr:LysR substrate-binding domain-containing protein [Zhengella mangrovi]